MRRGHTLWYSLVLLAVVVACPALASAQHPNGKQQLAPKALVVLKKGESTELCLCWDDGTGRMPVLFLGSEAVLTDKEKDFDGKPQYERDGVTAEYDEKQSANVTADLYKTGQLAGKQKDGSYKHVTCAVVRLRATHDANLGAHSIFVQIVSGTGRNMLLAGEFRVVVRE